MSDPIIVAAIIGGIFTLTASAAAIIIAMLSRRDAAAQAAAHSTVADAQNALIGRLQVDQAHSDAVITRGRAEISELRTRVDHLEEADGEKTARIHVLTEWGRWSTDPTPRTPPAWRQEGAPS